MEALQKEIVGYNSTHQAEEGFEKLRQLEQIADPEDSIVQQFILRSRVLLGRLDQRYSPQEQIDLLMQAIRLTVPRFTLEKIESFLYSMEEIKIISHIGSCYADDGKMKKQLIFIISCSGMSKCIFGKRSLPSAFFRWFCSIMPVYYFSADAIERRQTVQRRGREACIKYGHYQHLPGCLEAEAECRYYMGEREKSAEHYHQAYYLCKVTGYQAGLEIVKKEAKEYLGIEFQY